MPSSLDLKSAKVYRSLLFSYAVTSKSIIPVHLLSEDSFCPLYQQHILKSFLWYQVVL